MKQIGAVCAVLIVLLTAACSGGSSNNAASEESNLETGVKAPPVPKDLVAVTTTTTVANAPSTTVAPVPTGKTYWVAPSGNDKNAGTEKEPVKTIARGVDLLNAGDTLLLTTGTYSEVNGESAVRIKGLEGTADKWITIAAAPSAKPKVVGGEWQTINVEASMYVEFRGLEIEGTAKTDKKPTSGFEIRDSHHVRIVNNYVHDGGGAGIGTNASNHVDIIGNYVAGMSRWNPFQTSGISNFEATDIGGGPDADGYSMRIVGNIVYGNENIALPAAKGGTVVTDGNCIIIDTQTTNSYTGKTYIANNVCSNNGGRGIHVLDSSNVVAVNNTLYHNMQTVKLKEDGAELSAVRASNVVFRNNLVVGREDRDSTVVHEAKQISFSHNVFQHEKGSGAGDTDIVVPDAMIADPNNGNFALQAASPAIDAGEMTDAPTTDLAGTTRRNKPDAGAYEAAG